MNENYREWIVPVKLYGDTICCCYLSNKQKTHPKCLVLISQ